MSSESGVPCIHSRVSEGVATLTLDRPEVLNAMNFELMRELCAALDSAAEDQSVRVVVIAGAGRGFCSGADLASASSQTADDLQSAPEGVMDEVFHPAIRRLNSMPVPTIARIHGVVAGGGLGVALGCDLSIAAHSARFVCTFVPRLGIAPDLGSSWHMPLRMGRARALGAALLGDSIPAAQAAEWGLVWQAVPDAALDATVADAAARLARVSGDAVRRTRELMDTAPGRTLSEQLDAEAEAQRVLIPRNMLRAADAFLAKQKDPEFER